MNRVNFTRRRRNRPYYRRRRQRQHDYDILYETPSMFDLLVEHIGGWGSDVNSLRRQNFYARGLKGNHVDFLVGGANAAGRGLNGLSSLPFGAAITGKIKLYRHNQGDKLRSDLIKYLNNMKDGDPTPRVIGHSWGGATVANLAREFQDKNVPFIALDPVSRFGRLQEYPKNLTVFQPTENSDSGDNLASKLARIFGGAWPVLPDDNGKTIRYDGGHVDGVDYALNNFLRQQLQEEQTEKMKKNMDALESIRAKALQHMANEPMTLGGDNNNYDNRKTM